MRSSWPRPLVALALVGIVSACATTKSDAQRQADKATVERVQNALEADKHLYAKHITVRADNGVVRLTGYVWDRPDLDTARIIAAQVEGVTRVVNDLELQRNGMDNTGVTR